MNICSLQDTGFDFGLSRELSLQVLFKSSGFVFSVMEPISFKYFCLFEEKLDDSTDVHDYFLQHCKSNKWLSLKFKQVSFVYESANFLLHPEKLVSTTQGNELTMGTFFCNVGSTHQTNKMLKEKIAIQFDTDVSFQSLLIHQFGKCCFSHVAEAFLSYHARYMQKSATNHYQLYMASDFLLVLIVNNGRIVLFNSYPCKSDSDLLYYISLLQKTYPGKEMGIAGEFDIESNTMKRMADVFNLKPTSLSMDFNYLFSLRELDQSRYSTLLNNPLCE